MSTVYSHSRLSNFENCPKQFHYRYILKETVDTEGIEAFMGKRVHEVLERLYQFILDGRIPGLPKIINRYYEYWDEHFDESRIRIVRTENSPNHYRAVGKRCLENYYHRNYASFDRDETLGIEEKVAFSLDSANRYRIRGFIDRVVRTRDGIIEVHDYKTSARAPSQKKLDQDRQLAFYQLGIRNQYPENTKFRLVWHYLQPNLVRTSTRTSEQLNELCEKNIALIDRIEAETEFKTQVTPLCSWCEYRDRCPAHLSNSETKPVAKTTPRPTPKTTSKVTPKSASESAPESKPIRPPEPKADATKTPVDSHTSADGQMNFFK